MEREYEIHPITFRDVKVADLQRELEEVDRLAEGAWDSCWPDIPCPDTEQSRRV